MLEPFFIHLFYNKTLIILGITELHKLFKTCNNACTDTRKINKNDMFFALRGTNFDGNTYAKIAIEKGAKYVVIDNEKFNTSSQTILVDNVLNTLQLLATYHREALKTPIIAITGSNGKTTTKELMNIVLSTKYKTIATVGNLNNHIGVPLTLLKITIDTELAIIEMGANHQKEIQFLCEIAKPDFGYITNFGKAHLEGFGGVNGVIKGKSEMYDYLISHNKLIFINYNDPIQVEKTKKGNLYTFSNISGNVNMHIRYIDAKPFVKCCFNALKITSNLIGEYNFTNISAAITIGQYFKVSNLDIKKAIESYTPKNNRSEIINKDTNKIILDAYNANPSSMKAALLNFESQIGYKIAILGDMFELGADATFEHQSIVNLAASLNLNQIILIGKNFYNSKINSENTKAFETFELFEDQYVLNFNSSTILIKGSRGMALERVIKLL